MTLVEALNISRIATLAVVDGRYFATKTRMYFEKDIGSSEEVHNYTDIVCRKDWEAMGVVEGGEKK
jgi:hypothetical protein